MLRERRPRIDQPGERAWPEGGERRVQGQRERERERERAQQRASSLFRAGGEPGVEQARQENARDEDGSHNAEIHQNAGRRAEQRELPDASSPERAVREKERDGEHNEERDVFAVEERVRVQTRMQQEEQRGQQRERATAEEPQGEQVDEESAGEKEQMRQQMPAEVDRPAVLQLQRLLDEQDLVPQLQIRLKEREVDEHRQDLERYAVEPGLVLREDLPGVQNVA